jgi:hypothetical protein
VREVRYEIRPTFVSPPLVVQVCKLNVVGCSSRGRLEWNRLQRLQRGRRRVQALIEDSQRKECYSEISTSLYRLCCLSAAVHSQGNVLIRTFPGWLARTAK